MLKLIKNENHLESKQLKLAIVQSIASGECTMPEDVVAKFDVAYDQVINLFSDPHFINQIANYTKAKLQIHFHSKTVTKIQELAEDNDPKIALQAIKLEAQITNNLKSVGTDVNINLSLENLVRETEKQVNPVFDVSSRRVG